MKKEILWLALWTAQVLPACGKITSNCAVTPNGVVSWWDASKASGTTAIDSGPSNNNGIMSSLSNGGNGPRSSYFGFNGSSSVITVPNSSSLSPTSGLTISGWVKGNLDSTITSPLQTVASKWGFQKGSDFAAKSNWTGIDITKFSGLSTDGVTPWSAMAIQVGAAPFDGRYLYLADQGTSRIVRFDTQGSISSVTNWQVVKLSTFSGKTSDGVTNWSSYSTTNFYGGVFDGQYVYFVPGGGGSGKVARFDIQGTFTSPKSWEGVDISAFAGKASDGITSWSSLNNFDAGVYDGRYIYLLADGGTPNVVARYDTQKSFSMSSGWQGVAISSFPGYTSDGVTLWSSVNNSGTGTFDGRYVYLGAGSGPLARFDSQGSFTSPSSWQGANVQGFTGNATDGISPWSTFGAGISTFDGRYAYFTSDTHMMRFDTTQSDFAAKKNWQGVNVAAFAGAATDGVTLWSSFAGTYNGGGL